MGHPSQRRIILVVCLWAANVVLVLRLRKPVVGSIHSVHRSGHNEQNSDNNNAIPHSSVSPSSRFGTRNGPPADIRSNARTSVVDNALQLSWEEQTRFIRPGNLTNISYWRTPQPTPSGWWPNADWIRTTCVPHRFPLKPFPTLKRFRAYRLGDCVRFCRGCYIHRLKGTLAQQYFQRACRGQQGQSYGMFANHTLLHQIVDEFDNQPNFVKPDPNTMVVHLRLGDKVEWSNATALDMLHNSAEPHGGPVWTRMNAIKSVYEILTGIVESGASNVVIRGGSHFPQHFNKSKLYAYCLKEAVAKAGFNVTIRLDEGNPDVDFYFLSHAKMAMISMGGYSQFVGQSVLSRGGRVFGRVFGKLEPS